jgi:hypothetical protein
VEGYLQLYRQIVGAPSTLVETPPVVPMPTFLAKGGETTGTAVA